MSSSSGEQKKSKKKSSSSGSSDSKEKRPKKDNQKEQKEEQEREDLRKAKEKQNSERLEKEKSEKQKSEKKSKSSSSSSSSSELSPKQRTREVPLEPVERPIDPSTTHLFVDLAANSFLAGKPIEGLLVLVVQKPTRIQRISLIWKGLEYVSWFQGITGEKMVTGTEWWIAKRLFLFPDDGTVGSDKVFEPGAYTFPFVTLLRGDLPGSYEDVSDRWTDLNLTENLTPTLNTPDRSCIRYSVTGQCDIIMSNNAIGKITSTKDFNVVESFDTQCLFQQAAVRKAQNTFLFGGPLTGMLWVSNQGNILFGAPISVKVDILNKSHFTVEKVILTVWEHKTFKGSFENQPQTLNLSTKLHTMLINDSQTPAGGSNSKLVKFTVKASGPSITKAKLVSITYELQCQFIYMLNQLDMKVPLKLYGVCGQVRAELPEGAIPINIHNEKAQQLHIRQFAEVESGFTTF